jgi:Spy/CpxP family protein refolding chaperone
MKTRQVFNTVMGAALLSGTVLCAQQEAPQVPGGAVGGGRPPDRAQMRGGGEGQGGQGMHPDGMGPMRPRGVGFEGAPGMDRGNGPAGDGGRRMKPRGPDREGGFGQAPNPEAAKQAGATDQQIEALKTFVFEQRIKRVDLQAAAEKADLALDHLMQSETVDEKAALKAADALTSARGELFKQDISSRVKVREILGDAVLKKLHERVPPKAQGPCCVGAQCPRQQGARQDPCPKGEGPQARMPAPADQGGNPPPQTQDK